MAIEGEKGVIRGKGGVTNDWEQSWEHADGSNII